MLVPLEMVSQFLIKENLNILMLEWVKCSSYIHYNLRLLSWHVATVTGVSRFGKSIHCGVVGSVRLGPGKYVKGKGNIALVESMLGRQKDPD